MNNYFFSRPEEGESSEEFYNRLKKLSIEEAKLLIFEKYKIEGIDLLYKLLALSILDIERNQEINIPAILLIESYCDKLIKLEIRNQNIPKILKTWEGRLIVIGTFGLFIIELIKFIIDRLCF